MKKILIGICDLGQGHVNREKLLIELLIKKGYRLCLVTMNQKDFNYSGVKIIRCPVPWIATNNNGIDFNECLKKYNNQNFYKEFIKMCIEIEEFFDGIPDIVISDYEPNVAQYAYARDLKLINLEQQSKFLFINEQETNNIKILEEKSRLKFFFPKSDLRIISSFFPIKIHSKDNVIVTSPIINKKMLVKEEKQFVLVYFSPYGYENYMFLYKKILKMIKNITDIKFKIYSNLVFEDIKQKNIEFVKFNENFKKDISRCKFIITTSGHQLISEALYLEKPLLLTSFDTFEQNYNKKIVLKNKLGDELVNFNAAEVLTFDKNYNKYKKNIRKYNKKNKFLDWEKVFIDNIEEMSNK